MNEGFPKNISFLEFVAFLKESNKKFIAAYNSRDVEALGNIFAPDARIMPPNVPMMGPSGKIFYPCSLAPFILPSMQMVLALIPNSF